MPIRQATRINLGTLLQYLVRNCDAWDRRRQIELIAGHLGWTWDRVQSLGRRLREEWGVLVCTDDAKPAGMYIAASRTEAQDYIDQLERRIRGTIANQNLVRHMMNEKFPQGELL